MGRGFCAFLLGTGSERLPQRRRISRRNSLPPPYHRVKSGLSFPKDARIAWGLICLPCSSYFLPGGQGVSLPPRPPFLTSPHQTTPDRKALPYLTRPNPTPPHLTLPHRT